MSNRFNAAGDDRQGQNAYAIRFGGSEAF